MFLKEKKILLAERKRRFTHVNGKTEFPKQTILQERKHGTVYFNITTG